jgi:hypothetical protein
MRNYQISKTHPFQIKCPNPQNSKIPQKPEYKLYFEMKVRDVGEVGAGGCVVVVVVEVP